jgi:VTC domain
VTALDQRQLVPLPSVGSGPLTVRQAPALDLVGLAGLRPTSLAEVDAVAARQDRVDRKYLVPARVAAELVDELAGSHHLLRVKDRLTSYYRSLYFDLVDWSSIRGQLQGRRRQWKVRSRLYTQDAFCRLEVKAKDGRGRTVKHALSVDPAEFGTLTPTGAEFVADRLAAAGVEVDVARLFPGVSVDYTRATLADLTTGTRLTMDSGLAASYCGRSVRLREDTVLVETKGDLRPSGPDRLLLELGVRPGSVSKYGVAVSMLAPDLSANKWLRVQRDSFRLDQHPDQPTPDERPFWL